MCWERTPTWEVAPVAVPWHGAVTKNEPKWTRRSTLRAIGHHARQMRRIPTRAEALLWARVRDSQLGAKFRRQHPLGPFIIDFYCHSARLVIEVDGPVHTSSLDADSARDEFFIEHGIRVIHFTNNQVESDLDSVLERDKASAALKEWMRRANSPLHAAWRGGRG